MGGDGVAADSAGSLYFSTGNGTYDGPSPGGSTTTATACSSSTRTERVTDWFTPYNFQALQSGDIDLASGGGILLPDQAGAHPHEVIAGGKGGTVYVVDRDSMGHVRTTTTTARSCSR